MKFFELGATSLSKDGLYSAFKEHEASFQHFNFPDARDATPNEPATIMSKKEVDAMISFVDPSSAVYASSKFAGSDPTAARRYVIAGLAALNGWRYVAFAGGQAILVADVSIGA